MICVGVFGGFGHLALIRAYKITTASLLAPFGYTNLLWAAVLGIVMFNDIPDYWTLFGGAVIAAQRIVRGAARARGGGEPRMSVAAPIDRPVRGIVLMATAVLSLSVNGDPGQGLDGRLSHGPVDLGPVLLQTSCWFSCCFRGASRPFSSPGARDLQIVRAVLALIGGVFAITALHYMSLADLIAIHFLAPLPVTGLSVVALGEIVGIRRWAAVLIGFAGVLVIIRPGLTVFHWWVLLPVGMAMTSATFQTITRYISHTEDPLNTMFYVAIVDAAVTSAVVPFFWVTPSPEAWLMLVAIGLFAGLGQFAMVRAYERSQAAVVAPFAYTEIVWATILGLVVFGDLPDVWTFVGAAIIAASGLYVLHRERVKQVAPRRASRPSPDSAIFRRLDFRRRRHHCCQRALRPPPRARKAGGGLGALAARHRTKMRASLPGARPRTVSQARP